MYSGKPINRRELKVNAEMIKVRLSKSKENKTLEVKINCLGVSVVGSLVDELNYRLDAGINIARVLIRVFVLRFVSG